MRAVRPLRLVILSVLLALAALGADGFAPHPLSVDGKPPLSSAFQSVGSWQCDKSLAMDDKVVNALQLDDYLYRVYRREQGAVDLYVGYYRTAKKVGAAHDPLVCFQGQGWAIGRRDSGEYRLPGHPELTVSYSSMIAELDGVKQVVVYWFQANGKSAATTQSQKIAMVLDRIAGRSGDNAFVRLSAPVGNRNPEAVRQTIFRFIDDFYPQFLDYVRRMEKREGT